MNLACRKSVRTRRRIGRRGAALVEFAMTAPILFMFLFAALEFSRYNMIEQTANIAAFEAARTCILPGGKTTSTDTSEFTGEKAAKNVLGQVGIRSATVKFYDVSGTTSSPPEISGSISMSTSKIKATVKVPLTGNMWLNPVFLGSGTITKSCTMTCDWYNGY
jgi:Flp pilus assembly protein TadG